MTLNLVTGFPVAYLRPPPYSRSFNLMIIVVLFSTYILQSAAIGGTAHLVNFKGTDSLVALLFARRYYNCPTAGFSIPATEHRLVLW